MIAGASEGWSWEHSDLSGLLESWVGSVERATETQSNLKRTNTTLCVQTLMNEVSFLASSGRIEGRA
jgi:hypothetical protein